MLNTTRPPLGMLARGCEALTSSGLRQCALGRSPARPSIAAEPPPEITTIRLERDRGTCIAPLVVQELLRAEGFTDIRYVDETEALSRRADAEKSGVVAGMIAHGEVDFGRDFGASHVLAMNGGAPITVLAGLH